jgi:hypothetical protein
MLLLNWQMKILNLMRKKKKTSCAELGKICGNNMHEIVKKKQICATFVALSQTTIKARVHKNLVKMKKALNYRI